MPHIPGLRRVLRLDILGPRVEHEISEEVRFHLEEAVRDLVAGGLSEAEARAEAERRFGDVERYRCELAVIERERRAGKRRLAAWEAFAHDARYAARGLLRRPAFSLGVAAVLALGIGANATMFGVMDRLLLRPPPHVSNPDQLRRLAIVYPPSPSGGVPEGGFSLRVLSDLETVLSGLVEIGASGHEPSAMVPGNMTLGVGAEARPVRGILVTGGYLSTLGVRAKMGRLLMPSDDEPSGSEPAAVVGYGFWQHELGGTPGALGARLQVDGTWYTVVGVLPEDFRGVEAVTPDVWLPLRPALAASAGRSGSLALAGDPRMRIVVRLVPGIPEEAIEARATGVITTSAATSQSRRPSYPAELRPLRRSVVHNDSDEARLSVLLVGISTLLLLIASASAASLLLARALERQREIAVRLALGLNRRRLVVLLLTESLILTTVGGIAALALVRWGTLLLHPLLSGVTLPPSRPVDGRVLAFTVGVALLSGLVAGLVPAIQASRPALTGPLRRGAQEGGGRRSRARAGLAVVQTALCVVLLVGTGLFVKSLREASRVPLGFDSERVLVGGYDLRASDLDTTQVRGLFAAVAERIIRHSTVESVALANTAPFAGIRYAQVRAQGDEQLEHEVGSIYYGVTPSYFSTLGITLLRGRPLSETDDAASAPVAVVSKSMAEEYWQGRDPIGRCLYIGDDPAPCTTVVGVAEDIIPLSITEEYVRPQYYLPLAQSPIGHGFGPFLFVRTAPDADVPSVSAALRATMQGMAPGLPFADVRLLSSGLDRDLRPWRVGASLFGAFGALALTVAATGLFGLLAFGVAQRHREIGVRLALGAARGTVVRMIVGEGLLVASTGAAIGTALALASGPLVSGLLFRTAPNDSAVLLAVVATLLLVSLTASFLPAWRASRVSPAESLRTD